MGSLKRRNAQEKISKRANFNSLQMRGEGLTEALGAARKAVTNVKWKCCCCSCAAGGGSITSEQACDSWSRRPRHQDRPFIYLNNTFMAPCDIIIITILRELISRKVICVFKTAFKCFPSSNSLIINSQSTPNLFFRSRASVFIYLFIYVFIRLHLNSTFGGACTPN